VVEGREENMERRYQLSLEEDLLGRLKAATDLDDSDLVNQALLLLDWAVEEAERGRAIGSIDERRQEIREVILPALRAAVAR
jgi:hypothetical protein